MRTAACLPRAGSYSLLRSVGMDAQYCCLAPASWLSPTQCLCSPGSLLHGLLACNVADWGLLVCSAVSNQAMLHGHSPASQSGLPTVLRSPAITTLSKPPLQL